MGQPRPAGLTSPRNARPATERQLDALSCDPTADKLAGLCRPVEQSAPTTTAAPMQRYAWDVYRVASQVRCVGVLGGTADEAIETAAVEFNTDDKKLIAVRRFEIA
jgi:hypothetical protein